MRGPCPGPYESSLSLILFIKDLGIGLLSLSYQQESYMHSLSPLRVLYARPISSCLT
jgi:hypothetical protein